MNLDKFLGCIFALANGDAAGMPFETMTAEEIVAWGGDVKAHFLPTTINPHPFPEMVHLPPGSWTDDTQLTLTVEDSITDAGGIFNMDAIARRHVLALDNRKGRGWGKSTQRACERLKRGVSWRESAEPNGGGNGVVMKIAPLGLLESVQHVTFDEICLYNALVLGRMTHGDPAAVVAGVVHAEAIRYLACSPNGLLPPDFLRRMLDVAYVAEIELKDQEKKITAVLREVQKLVLSEETPATIAARFGTGGKEAFRAYNSLAVSYACFLKGPESFDSVYSAIQAGGDTDSNASIVGSLLGALHGMRIVPKHLLDTLKEADVVRNSVLAFYNSVGLV